MFTATQPQQTSTFQPFTDSRKTVNDVVSALEKTLCFEYFFGLHCARTGQEDLAQYAENRQARLELDILLATNDLQLYVDRKWATMRLYIHIKNAINS